MESVRMSAEVVVVNAEWFAEAIANHSIAHVIEIVAALVFLVITARDPHARGFCAPHRTHRTIELPHEEIDRVD